MGRFSTLHRSPHHRFARAVRAAVQCGFALFVLAAAPASLHANTYMFSFTANDVLNALSAQNPTDASTGYFAIFLQPQLSTYSYGSVLSPNLSNPSEAWDVGTITDFSTSGTGTWARFDKGQTQSNIEILTNGVNNLGQDYFLGHSYSDTLAWPVGWGTVTGTIQVDYHGTEQFNFYITTASTISTSVTVKGLASGIVSNSSSSWVSPKTSENISFNLSELPSLVVPEPESWIFLGTGTLLLMASRRRTAKGHSKKR